LVRLSGVGTAADQFTASRLLNAQVERFCGALGPAPVCPVTLDVSALLAQVHDRNSLRSCLAEQRCDADQIEILTVATDVTRSAQASLVALQSGVDGRPGRVHVESGTVTVIDTPSGRLVTEHVDQAGRTWMIVSPGTPRNIAAAIQKMLRRLPANEEWHSFRKVV